MVRRLDGYDGPFYLLVQYLDQINSVLLKYGIDGLLKLPNLLNSRGFKIKNPEISTEVLNPRVGKGIALVKKGSKGLNMVKQVYITSIWGIQSDF